ncbi:MAG: peptidylprolyl isomerase [Planctomycetales bacterium]|nr:peptidylprolyl isomerase [Planctomycetales bacterium]
MRRVWLAGWMALVLGGGFMSVSSAMAQDDPAPEAGAQEAPAATPEAQDPSPAVEDPAAQEGPEGDPFERLYTQWNELAAQAKAKAEEFAQAGPDDRDAVRTSYNEIVGQMEQLLPELRAAAFARYEAEEAPDEELTKLVIGMLINDAVAGRADQLLEEGELLIEKRCPRELLERAVKAPRLGLFTREALEELLLRYDEAVADDLPRVKITTAKGEIVVELFENEAPNTVANFISLAEKGSYNGSTFHRVLDNFVAQGGMVTDTDDGDPGYTIKCECYQENYRHHYQGSLAMAKTQARDSGNSQFYLVMERNATVANLDGNYTVFGRIVSGIEVLDLITRRDPAKENQPEVGDTIVSVEVLRKRDHEYVPVTIARPEAPAAPGN